MCVPATVLLINYHQMLVKILVLQATGHWERPEGSHPDGSNGGKSVCVCFFSLQHVQHRNPLGLHDLGLKTNVAVLFQGSMRHQWLCDCGESPSVTCTIFCKRGHIIFQMPANIVTLFYFFPRCEVLDVEKCGFDNITRIWGL